MSASERQKALMISIHAPPEGSDQAGFSWYHSKCISIHAPPEGSDLEVEAMTPKDIKISIHAPPEGSDGLPRAVPWCLPHFNPRSP